MRRLESHGETLVGLYDSPVTSARSPGTSPHPVAPAPRGVVIVIEPSHKSHTVEPGPPRQADSDALSILMVKPMMNRRSLILAPLAAATLALTGCASVPAPTSVADTLATRPEFSTLAKLVNDADLASTLKGAGPFTVLAPTNAAFAKVPAKTMAELAADKARLRNVLTYHVIPGALASADIKPGNVKTVQGSNVALSRAGTFVTVEDGLVTQADIKATNGVVHGIDTVLIPPAPRR